MYITSISLSYFFLGLFIFSMISFFYFKLLVLKTSPGKSSREKIIGSMKDPITWRKKNNLLSYISAFWSVLSLIVFVYFKFFYKAGLVNMIYLFAYILISVLTIVLFGIRKKAK